MDSPVTRQATAARGISGRSEQLAARVLCCTAAPHPAAMAALAAYSPQAEVLDVAGDDFGYWAAIAARWTGERDLIVIEQDIMTGPGTVAALEDCGQPWCTCAYLIFGGRFRLTTGLGCTKISAAAQRLVPASQVAASFSPCTSCLGRGCWWHLDSCIAVALKQAGLAPHVHGDVTHCPAHDV